jgi:hypothetical protein
MSPICGTIGVGRLQEWGIVGGRLVIGAVHLRRQWEPAPPLPLQFVPSQEVNSSALLCAPAMMCCLTTGPKAKGPISHGLKPLKL